MRHDIENPFAAARALWSSPALRSVPLNPDEVSSIVNADDPAAALIAICRQRYLIASA